MTPPIDSWDGTPEWLSAFEGIDYKPQAGTALSFNSVVGPRLRRRVDTERVLVPIGSLYSIAKRIDALSTALVEAQTSDQGGMTVLDADTLRSYEAMQAAAERATAKVGVLVEDAQADWSALYDAAGKCVHQGHLSELRGDVVRDSWTTTRIDAEGFHEAHAGYEDGFPPTLGELQRVLRKQAAAERAATTQEQPTL